MSVPTSPHLHKYTRSRLLTLPPEIRHLIWTAYYTQIDPPYMRISCEGGFCEEIHFYISLRLPLTCKLLHVEVLPILKSHFSLHSCYPEDDPVQPSYPQPDSLAEMITRVYWHMAVPDDPFHRERLPAFPFKLQRFPNLRELTIVCPIGVDLEEIMRPRVAVQSLSGSREPSMSMRRDGERAKPSTKSLTKEQRDTVFHNWLDLSRNERLKLWQNHEMFSAEALIDIVTDAGRGGWLSRLVDPARYPKPLELKADINPEGDDDDNDHDYDGGARPRVEVGETKEQAEARELRELREMAADENIDILLEIEVLAMQPHMSDQNGGEDVWRWEDIEVGMPLLVLVDARKRRIIEARALASQEYRERFDRCRLNGSYTADDLPYKLGEERPTCGLAGLDHDSRVRG